jgi:hypothetical protein
MKLDPHVSREKSTWPVGFTPALFAHLRSLNEGGRACETRAAHPLLTHPHPPREVGVLKRHGVGDGDSGLGALYLPRQVPGSKWPAAPTYPALQ